MLVLKLSLVVAVILRFQIESAYVYKAENESCFIENTKEEGTCIPYYKCLHAKRVLTKKEQPQICGFEGKIPFVCCVDIVGSKLLKKCEEYHRSTALSSAFAIGGDLSLPQEYPHMAIIGYGDDNDIQYQCGGSLITEQHVLTAAHCLISKEFGEATHVRLGDLDIKNNSDKAEPQDFKITRRIPHPDYNPPANYHDIAVVVLDRPVEITGFVTPTCLHLDHDLPKTSLRATGWGVTEYGGEPSSHLIKVELQFVNHSECNKAYSSVSKTKLPKGILDESQFCAGGLGKDTCEGDSGGPIQYKMSDYEGDAVVGVTSFGKACGLTNSPGVYTRVSHYTKWIESVIFS